MTVKETAALLSIIGSLLLGGILTWKFMWEALSGWGVFLRILTTGVVSLLGASVGLTLVLIGCFIIFCIHEEKEK